MGDIYQLTDVRKEYLGRTVLSLPELAIAQGEVLALVGPSGAGKTTLLRLLNFLEPPTAGTIVFDGLPVGAGISLETRRRVTAVYENPALLSRSVVANINYGLGLRKEKLPDADMARWLERLGISALAKQPARKLSAGEAQRVALARALVLRPDVLLLDEPTNRLDPYNVGLIERLVLEEQAATGMTVVIITHDIFQARRMARRVGLLLGGRLVELAPAAQFFESPASSQTAAFLRGELVY